MRHTIESKESSINASKKYWSDLNNKKLASEFSRELWKNASFRSKIAKSLLNTNSFTNWTAEERSKFSKSLWSNTDFRNNLLKFLKGPLREFMIKLWTSDDYREHLSNTAFWRPQPSKLQRKLIPIFEKLKIKWFEEFKVKFYHFDYCLPEHNILIEVQGNYWHSKPDAKIRDQRKKSFIDNNTTYKLVEIWEDRFNDLQKLELDIKELVSII